MRIGFGYDVHKLVEGRPLILGGVTIAYHLGLEGHSDADVLLHAIADALLGAAALGDIGQHFPDTDERWRGADSRLLLKEVSSRVRSEGYSVVNVDATIGAQRPKILPYISDMRTSIASAIGIGKGQVSVKATTTEKLGFVGREQGIAAWAVCLIENRGNG